MSFAPMIRWFVLSATVLGLFSAVAQAKTEPSALCVAATRTAAQATGVPFETLLAISVVESGRALRPWPWTVNLDGEGHWLETAEAAERLVADALNRGATNIDIGCFQLNYRWHAGSFRSIEEMLDPARNALYAADYLAERFAETGDWSLAAAAYHSATPEHAARYQARFEETSAKLGEGSAMDSDTAAARSNGFPFLIAGASGKKGSLVPATSGGPQLFGGP